jgi:hypothetical protein
MSISNWPPPVHVRPALRHARRRYHQLPLVQRPATNNFVGLFTLADLITLAQHGYWPLPQKALVWIAETPLDRARRQKRSVQKVKTVVRDVLAEELPAAVAFLVGRAAS